MSEEKNQKMSEKKNSLFNKSQIPNYHMELTAINSELIIEILKKQPSERDTKEYSILNDYILLVSKLTEKFRSQKIPKSLYEKIISSSLTTCKLKVFLSMNSQIYTPETEANYVYIVLKGAVKIIKTQKQIIKLNSFDYFKIHFK